MDAGQALDYQPGPGLRAKKNARARLIRWASTQSDWVLGFEDETWWSRLAQPNLHAWTVADHPVRLLEKTLAKTDLEPKATVCYGLLARWQAAAESQEQIWLRFANGHAKSGLTTQFLAWCCDRVQACGKRVLALIWDNASWHLSAEVKQWVRAHNQQVKRQGHGVRLLICPLPTKSPWLNPIEPKWQFGKRQVVEPARILSVDELAERVCATLDCAREALLTLPDNVP